MASRQRNKVDDTDLNLKVSDVLESLAKETLEATGLWIIWHIPFFFWTSGDLIELKTLLDSQPKARNLADMALYMWPSLFKAG